MLKAKYGLHISLLCPPLIIAKTSHLFWERHKNIHIYIYREREKKKTIILKKTKRFVIKVNQSNNNSIIEWQQKVSDQI